jgi:hypothetical protein
MRGVLKSAALTIAVLAMMLRAALPDGWMPSAQASAPLMLCPGMNDMSAMAGMDHRNPAPAPPHDQDHGGMVCAFSAIAHFAAPTDPTAVLAQAAVWTFVSFVATHDAPLRAVIWQPNAARAPPALA